MRISAGKKMFSVKDCRGLSCVRGLMFDGMEDIDGALVRGSSIWMPFVKHELELFFIDRNMKTIKKSPAVPMSLNPKTWKTYSCNGARYCLEMKKGLCKAKVGAKVKIMGSAGKSAKRQSASAFEPAASCV
ncbi:MAG: DUF192 domain-containing protein [Candidatus Aenigmarchaeota archaeon]|nr:DUF192 domain-containing protein [Candidatus Aenigmarchaeota archaeon]